MSSSMKRSSKKYTTKRRRSSTKALVYKTVKNQLQRAAEKKIYDEDYTITMDINGSLNNIFEPAQGAGISDVVGIKATVTSVEVAITLISPAQPTTQLYNQARVTLLTWKGLNVPTLGDIYENVNVDYLPLSSFNIATKKMRKIHYDMVFDQYWVAANGFAQDPLKTVKFYVPMANAKGRINEVIIDTGGFTNGLYLFVTANNGGAANTKWNAVIHTRVTYLDM